MTSGSPADDELQIAEIHAPPVALAEPRSAVPRLWTVFLAYLAAFACLFVVQFIAVIAFAAWHLARGGTIQQLSSDLTAMLSTPGMFIAFASMSQIAIALAAFVPARLSPEPARWRLGLVAPALPMWSYVIIAIGSLVPLAVGVALAVLVARVVKPDASVQHLYKSMTWAWAVPFVLFIALVPGFVEETFFRGYMQRRLLERFTPAVAILVTTFLFAIMHVMPHAVVNAFVIGLWLGILAWRTGSVWPGVVGHAFINGAWNVWNIGEMLGVFPRVPHVSVTVAISALVLGCFLASIWLIARCGLPTGAVPEAPPPDHSDLVEREAQPTSASQP